MSHCRLIKELEANLKYHYFNGKYWEHPVRPSTYIPTLFGDSPTVHVNYQDWDADTTPKPEDLDEDIDMSTGKTTKKTEVVEQYFGATGWHFCDIHAKTPDHTEYGGAGLRVTVAHACPPDTCPLNCVLDPKTRRRSSTVTAKTHPEMYADLLKNLNATAATVQRHIDNATPEIDGTTVKQITLADLADTGAEITKIRKDPNPWVRLIKTVHENQSAIYENIKKTTKTSTKGKKGAAASTPKKAMRRAMKAKK